MVRLAESADLGAVEDIIRQAYQPFAALIDFRPAPMDADYASLIADGSVYVTGSGDIDGVLVVVPEDDALLVENVAVRPDRQGRGIGRMLLAFAETEARRLGLPALRLYTHAMMTDNITMYEGLGYAVTAHEAVAVGHRIHMRKQLVPSPS